MKNPSKTAREQNPKGRHWIFTLNNYTEDDVQACHLLKDHVNVIVVAKETGESGTPHLQGTIGFKDQMRKSTVRKFFNGRAHWEVSNAQAPEVYCLKEPPIIKVDNRAPGIRTDLTNAMLAATSGKSK